MGESLLADQSAVLTCEKQELAPSIYNEEALEGLGRNVDLYIFNQDDTQD